METYLGKIQNYQVGYTNKEEFKILKKEIFEDKIYDLEINNAQEIIDVGAHLGLATIYFKTKYPKSHILSFEPNPNIFPILEENVIYNRIDNVELKNVALGSKEEIRNFYIDDSGADCFSTAGFTKNSWEGTQATREIKVKVDKLSKFIDKNIDILKIDAEGAEVEIIKELDEEDKLRYIKNVIIEFHPINKRKPSKLITILETNHFKVDIRKDSLGSELIDILGKNTLK